MARGYACRMRSVVCFFNDTATTEIYTLSLHDALPLACMRLTILAEPCSAVSAAMGRTSESSRAANRQRLAKLRVRRERISESSWWTTRLSKSTAPQRIAQPGTCPFDRLMARRPGGRRLRAMWLLDSHPLQRARRMGHRIEKLSFDFVALRSG